MTRYPFYEGSGTPRPDAARALPGASYEKFFDPDGFLPDDGLVQAVNVALLLGQPLLLTGDPGSGKTLVAYSVARELDLYPPEEFVAKSTSEARDLLYTYDALGHFRAAPGKDQANSALPYIEFQALGRAILRASRPEEVTDLFPAGSSSGPRRSVVLVDEIDKAPRDFPNDLLREIESMKFRIPELAGREVRAAADHRPVVVITSNSEKLLPDAFLRRCIFYDVPFPDDKKLEEIVARRLGGIAGPQSE